MDEQNLTLRRLYQLAELPGKNPLKDAQANLDLAVRSAYGMQQTVDPLSFLLELNFRVALDEQNGTAVQPPGIPSCVVDAGKLTSKDRMEIQPRAITKQIKGRPFAVRSKH